MLGEKTFKKNRRSNSITYFRSVFSGLLLSLLVILNVYLLSCADDSIDSVEDFQTFLEKNDGSEWLLRNDTLKVFIRINNNETHLIEQWYYLEESNCFNYNPNIFIPGDCSIKENSNECLIVRGDIILSDFDYMTFSNQGDLLRVHITINEWEDDMVFFTKSPERVDDLKHCKPLDKISCLFFKACH